MAQEQNTGREMAEGMSRREFAAVAACAAAGVAVTGAGGCARAIDTIQVDTPTWEFGEETEMDKRVLVGYATGKGSTVGVAEAIGKGLAERGYAADVMPMSACSSLAGYDAVVLGSAVNGGAWLPQAVSWVERHKDELGARPVAAFCVHGMNAGDDEKQTRKRLAYLDAVRAVVDLTDEGYFLGDMGEMNGFAKFAFKAFGGAGEGDLRDWDAIGAWAAKVAV